MTNRGWRRWDPVEARRTKRFAEERVPQGGLYQRVQRLLDHA
jgi:hypothetical protein